MMARTSCCFLSIHTNHRYFRITSGFNRLHLTTKTQYIGATSPSISYWSLQAHQNDQSTPPKRGRRQRRARDTIVDFDNVSNNDITSVLFKPVSIPFSDNGTSKQKQTVAAIYPLSVFAAIVLLPPITSLMLTLFFGAYLALLLPIMNGYDDFSLDENEQEQDDDERKLAGTAPAVAFLGAVASASLLSPQGVVFISDEKRELLSMSFPYNILAVLLVGLGGYVLFTGVNGTATDMREWDEEEMDALSERRERSIMSKWDDQLNEKKD